MAVSICNRKIIIGFCCSTGFQFIGCVHFICIVYFRFSSLVNRTAHSDSDIYLFTLHIYIYFLHFFLSLLFLAFCCFGFFFSSLFGSESDNKFYVFSQYCYYSIRLSFSLYNYNCLFWHQIYVNFSVFGFISMFVNVSIKSASSSRHIVHISYLIFYPVIITFTFKLLTVCNMQFSYLFPILSFHTPKIVYHFTSLFISFTSIINLLNLHVC